MMATEQEEPTNVTQLRGGLTLIPRADRDWVTTHELVAEAGISYRQADYWIRTGFLHPDVAHPGHGVPRSLPEDQVPRARTAKALLDAGITLEAVRATIDDLLTHGTATRGPVTIIIHQPDDQEEQ
jgi:DNA-binding transcriptional MerR regulator